MGKSLIKDQDGIAMIFVIMTMLVVSLLSVAALGMSTSNVKNSLTEREFQTSYYIAEAGANLYTEHIKGQCKKVYEESSDSDSFFTKLENDNTNALVYTIFFEGHPEGYIPKAESRLLLPAVSSSTDSRTYSIVSRGTSNHATRVVKKLITIEYVKGFSLESFKGVYSKGVLKVTNSGKIESSLASETQIEIHNDANISDYYLPDSVDDLYKSSSVQWWPSPDNQIGEHKVLTKIDYTMPDFPDFPTPGVVINLDPISGNKHETITLTEDVTKIPSINLASGCRLTIDVGDKDRELIVGDIKVPEGYIRIKGTGNLKLYVEGKIEFGGSTIINHPDPLIDFDNHSVDYIKNAVKTNVAEAEKNARIEQSKNAANKLSIYYKGKADGETEAKKLNISGAQHICGSIFAEDADVDIGGSGAMFGTLITGGNTVNVSGGSGLSSNLIYAPNALVTVSGSGKIVGPIVSNEFVFDGGSGTSLDFDPSDGLTGDTFNLVTPGEVKINEGVAREQ